jgi:hypothetical protein
MVGGTLGSQGPTNAAHMGPKARPNSRWDPERARPRERLKFTQMRHCCGKLSRRTRRAASLHRPGRLWPSAPKA